jgi:hypothetical protein
MAKASSPAGSARFTTAAVNLPHILPELKWIGLVTAFIVVLLVLAYVFIPK